MTANVQKIDLFVDDVLVAAALLRDIFEFDAVHVEPDFAELHAGVLSVMLSRTARVPISKTSGVVLHLLVPDAAIAADDILTRGGEIVLATETTPWGTTSTLFRGPGETLIDVYQDA